MTEFTRSTPRKEQSPTPVREAETVFVIFNDRSDVESFRESLSQRFPRFAQQEDALAWQQPFYQFQSPSTPREGSPDPATVALNDVSELERAVIEQLAAGKAEIKSATEVFAAAREQSRSGR
jgi:hypothetical protein